MSVASWIFLGIVAYADIVMVAVAFCRHCAEQDQHKGDINE